MTTTTTTTATAVAPQPASGARRATRVAPQPASGARRATRVAPQPASSARRATRVGRERRSGARRAIHVAAAIVAGLFLAFEADAHGAWALALVGLLLPDLAMLRGMGSSHAPGQLSPRAVPLYNAAHRFWIPLALIAVACVPPKLTAPYIVGLAWATHILIDRAAGYGLRGADGFRRPL